MKSEVNWQAVGAIAAAVSAVIALLAFATHANGTNSRNFTPPNYVSSPTATATAASASVPLSSLPDPCEASTSSTINSFGLDLGQPDNGAPDNTDPSQVKLCMWKAAKNQTYDFFMLSYDTFSADFGPSPFGDPSPASIPGVSKAVEYRANSGLCNITWNTSFGSIDVTASVDLHFTGQVDPCVGAQQWAEALLPNLPT